MRLTRKTYIITTTEDSFINVWKTRRTMLSRTRVERHRMVTKWKSCSNPGYELRLPAAVTTSGIDIDWQ